MKRDPVFSQNYFRINYFCRKCGVPCGKIPTSNFIKLQLNNSHRHGKVRALNEWFHCPDTLATNLLLAPIKDFTKRPTYIRKQNAKWFSKPIRGHSFKHNGITRLARDAWENRFDNTQSFLHCTKCEVAISWKRRNILEQGSTSLPNGAGECSGSTVRIRTLKLRVRDQIKNWIDNNPTNQHKIVFLEDELRWHCASCNKIGGTFFSFDRAPKMVGARSGDVNHAPMPKLFDGKIFKALNTACEHHKLPERKL